MPHARLLGGSLWSASCSRVARHPFGTPGRDISPCGAFLHAHSHRRTLRRFYGSRHGAEDRLARSYDMYIGNRR